MHITLQSCIFLWSKLKLRVCSLSSLQALCEECPSLKQGRVPKALDQKKPLQGPTQSRTGQVVQKWGHSLEMGPNR